MTAVGDVQADQGTYVMVDDIIGPGEILELAGGVTRQTFKRWRDRPDFPKPIRELDIGELWDRRAVAAWLEEHRA